MTHRALSVEPWLAELAVQDDPPTEIDSSLLARFALAGVSELVPSDGTKTLPVAEADHAIGIGAKGPGLGFGESFEDEPAPVAGALERLLDHMEAFDRLRRLRLAAIDMRLAEGAALGLLDEEGPARFFARVIETGLVVAYARPYVAGNRAGVGDRWRPTEEEDRKLHDRVIDELRDPYHAHADHTPHRTLMDTTAMLGLEGSPTYAEAWWILTREELTAIADLARRQAERFEEGAHEAGRALGEEREASSGWNV